MRRWFFTALAIVAVTPAATEEIYKWTDENGVVHFGSRKPDAVDAEQVKLRGSGQTAEAPSADVADGDASIEAPSEPTEPERRNEAQRKELCTRSLASLDAMESGQRVLKQDRETGASSVLQGPELTAAIAEARKNVEVYCEPIK